MFKCRCLCGDVEFEIRANPSHAINCHCRSCRKSHGAPYVTVLVVLSEHYEITKGVESLSRLPCEKQKTGRYICSSCGSKLFTETAPGLPISVYTSTLVNEELVKVIAHTNVESKCSTVVIQDDLPQFERSITKEDYMKLAV